MLPLDT
jgi:serine/threonine protein kinase